MTDPGYQLEFESWFACVSGLEKDNLRLTNYLQQNCLNNNAAGALTCIAQQPVALAIEEAQQIADVLEKWVETNVSGLSTLPWLAGHFAGIASLGTALGVALVPISAETWEKTRLWVLANGWQGSTNVYEQAVMVDKEHRISYEIARTQLTYWLTEDVVHRLRLLTQAQLGRLLILLSDQRVAPRQGRDTLFETLLRAQLDVVESE